MLTERIEAFFRSSDREMWRLGQKLCHEHRISYYVLVDAMRVLHMSGKQVPLRPLKYTLIEPPPVQHFGRIWRISMYNTYKIVLDESTKRKNRGVFPELGQGIEESGTDTVS